LEERLFAKQDREMGGGGWGESDGERERWGERAHLSFF